MLIINSINMNYEYTITFNKGLFLLFMRAKRRWLWTTEIKLGQRCHSQSQTINSIGANV